MRLRLDEIYDKRLLQQKMQVSALEHDSWVTQLEEAQAYQVDNSASVPMIQALATARGIELSAMVTKVIEAHTAYNIKVQNLLSAKQIVETEIKACTTISNCCLILHTRFEVQMSDAQAQDENIDSDPAFNV